MNLNTPQKFSAAIAALYTWMVTTYFGFVLLDILYANRVPQAKAAFSSISDFLLLVGCFTILAAFGAAVLSWRSKMAVGFYVASLFVLLLEFLLPVILPLVLQNAQGLSWLRPLPSGFASIFAFLGLYGLFFHQPAALKNTASEAA